VAINFNIVEGRAKIKRINIVGTRRTPRTRFSREYKLRTPGMFSVLQERPVLAAEAAGDLESLRSFYLNRLHRVQHRIDPGVDTPDRRDIYITNQHHERGEVPGHRVRFGGDCWSRDELRSLERSGRERCSPGKAH